MAFSVQKDVAPEQVKSLRNTSSPRGIIFGMTGRWLSGKLDNWCGESLKKADTGYWMEGRYWMLDTGYWIKTRTDTGCWIKTKNDDG
jgi:hypothetical protein